ncbi:DNA polymerase [Methanosarcina sp.]|uniref:DNA polymerase n=1 Tax=Methanosarcina sp. TaxID=2213 RepID=UPI003C77DE10
MPFLFLDIETDGLDSYTCNLVTLQILTQSGKTILLKDPDNLDAIKPKLENNVIVGHGIKFDSKFLKYRYGITLKNVYDTYIAEIAISGGLLARRKGASLKDLVFKYCGVTLDKSEQCGFKRGVDLTEEQKEYALNDLVYLPQIMQRQRAMIDYLGISSVVDTEMKALPAVVWLELSGVNTDVQKVAEINSQLEERRVKLAQSLANSFKPHTVNINSPVQLKDALNRLGIPVDGTSAGELMKYDHPVIDTLLEYREVNTLITKFTSRIQQFINPVTGRVHSDFNQYGAKSGRFTSSNPNLQQQPSRFTEWRSIYKAASGYKIITADYSQIELRILGQVSQDKEFLRAYNSGEDLHQLTASKIYRVPLDQVTKVQRTVAKKVNFGLSYGLWVPGLIKNLRQAEITLGTEEAEKVIKDYFKAYPSVKSYLWDISEEGAKKFALKNKAGRYIKFERTLDKSKINSVKRQSKNLPIQSLCADMIKVAMANIFLKLEPKGVIRFVNTIHDELCFEAPEAMAEEVAQIVKEEMEKAGKVYLKDLPCVAEVTVADCWSK